KGWSFQLAFQAECPINENSKLTVAKGAARQGMRDGKTVPPSIIQWEVREVCKVKLLLLINHYAQDPISAIERAKEQNDKKRFTLKLREDRRMPQMPLKNLFLQSLYLPLHTQERSVNRAVWILLKGKLHLLEHFDAMQHFFFLHNEGFVQSLALHFLDLMEKVDEAPLSTYE
ncbi:unnamed protein product, partial [Darwinula stevensoni]